MQLIRRQGYKDETPKQYVNHINSEATIPVIGLHSGCFGGIWKKKTYPYFEELARRLCIMNFQILNFGSENERLNLEHDKFNDFAGKLDLQQTINIVQQCKYFIANDSGLMHIADALNIPLIALFGPTLVTKNRPVNKDSYVLVSNNCLYGKNLNPCQYTDAFAKCSDNICLKSIKVENIINFMRELNWID